MGGQNLSDITGHIDGVAEIIGRADEDRSTRYSIRVPGSLARYIARKGSVCLDGVSLTVNEVDGDTFGVNLIPHTQEVTTLHNWAVGSTDRNRHRWEESVVQLPDG